ncbi:hypothetical protein ABVF61_26580 [Roseibium sp. HPY-6]|uniref:hypothetical protein n=1 Tax=Roseibium sp. HPY-6 TaxID=3229852 RepID=UPI00338DB0D2
MKHSYTSVRASGRLSAGLILFVVSTTAVNSTELRYWVSENYSEAPNVNTGLAEQFLLEIFEPALPLASEPNASDAIVCFDNRPLHEAIAENSKNYLNGADRNVDHCKNHKQKRNQIHADSSSKENTDEMLKGITVSINGTGKIYCGSIFTGHSFFSFLGQEGIYDSKPV